MKVAVTGAGGFVGRHVLTALARRSDARVTAVHRSPDRAQASAGARTVVLDIGAPPGDVYDALGRPDVLVHLAWGGLPNYQSLHHFESELPRQYAFLRAMVDGGLRSMLVTGTCYEYGMRCGEVDETLSPCPANPYAHAKAALQQQLEYLRLKQPFDLTWARLFYMYGEGQAPTSLYAQLMRAIAQGDPSFPMSGGEQLRDFLPVTDVASLIVQLALDRPGAGTVNVCSGRPVSVRALVERLVQEQGATLPLELGRYPYPSHEPMAFWGSTARLHSLLRVESALPRQ